MHVSEYHHPSTPKLLSALSSWKSNDRRSPLLLSEANILLDYVVDMYLLTYVRTKTYVRTDGL